MVCEGQQLEALLSTGDFVALPLGSPPSDPSQVTVFDYWLRSLQDLSLSPPFIATGLTVQPAAVAAQ